MLVEEQPNKSVLPDGPKLWCTYCSQEVDTGIRTIILTDASTVDMPRCRQCGNWIKCPECMFLRSTEHACSTDE